MHSDNLLQMDLVVRKIQIMHVQLAQIFAISFRELGLVKFKLYREIFLFIVKV